MLVFNTLSGAAATMPCADVRPMLAQASCGSGSKPIWRRFIPENHDPIAASMASHSMETLAKLGILVESAEAEGHALNSFLQAYWHPRTLKLTLAYTAACQMACGYCFQRGRNLKSHHSPRVFQATLNFIRDHLSSHPELERVHLGLFGGEPLVDAVMASAYVDHLQRIAREFSLPLDISLTSNGLNLNRQLVLDWQPKGLKYVRVTLDGPPRVHDRRRPGRGNQPTFQRILRNLQQIRDLQGFGLGVSINLDADNADYVEELLEILVEAGLQSEVEILLEATLPTIEGGAGDPILEDHRKQGQIMSRALDQVILKGFRTPIYPGLCLPCNFVQSNNFIIDWSGQLFRCTFTMLDPQARVGSVSAGVSPRNQELLQSRQVVAGCREKQCAYLPLCGGGCRYEAHLRGGDWSASCCPIEFWDEVLPRSLLHNLQALAVPK